MVSGTLSAPWIFSSLLMACVFLLGICTAQLYWVGQEQKDVKTELRIIQVHIEDTNAILIRECLLRQGDLPNGPTSGKR